MRSLILVPALALASCGGDQTANDAAVSQEAETIEVTAVNDITAIDAATGQAANMAADVEFTINEAEMNEAAGNAAGNATDNETADDSL